VRAFGGNVHLTRQSHLTGTDRVAEVAEQLPGIDVVVNLQGDEPELPASSIDLTIELLERDSIAVMATLATPIRSLAELNDPSCVKVVCDNDGRALYFSRSPIPHAGTAADESLSSDPAIFYRHIGIYAYRRDFLLHLAALPQSRLEKLESLEQLRALENGFDISVGIVESAPASINTRDDYDAFVRRMNREEPSLPVDRAPSHFAGRW
jgi:3-deoxy-manno-octulosonate cytidylyltransferase (CMP-KDO synthetase)